MIAQTILRANRCPLFAMIREVVAAAGPGPGNMLELYAGVGFFSIPLARDAQEVIAIESNRMAVQLAQENARRNETWQLRSVEGNADATVRGSSLRPNVVVLDPPRAGCGVEPAEQIA